MELTSKDGKIGEISVKRFLVIADGGPEGLYKVEGSFADKQVALDHCLYCQHQYGGRWLIAAT